MNIGILYSWKSKIVKYAHNLLNKLDLLEYSKSLSIYNIYRCTYTHFLFILKYAYFL